MLLVEEEVGAAVPISKFKILSDCHRCAQFYVHARSFSDLYMYADALFYKFYGLKLISPIFEQRQLMQTGIQPL